MNIDIARLLELAKTRTQGVLQVNQYDRHMADGRRLMRGVGAEYARVSTTNPHDDEYIVAACNALPGMLDAYTAMQIVAKTYADRYEEMATYLREIQRWKLYGSTWTPEELFRLVDEALQGGAVNE